MLPHSRIMVKTTTSKDIAAQRAFLSARLASAGTLPWTLIHSPWAPSQKDPNLLYCFPIALIAIRTALRQTQEGRVISIALSGSHALRIVRSILRPLSLSCGWSFLTPNRRSTYLLVASIEWPSHWRWLFFKCNPGVEIRYFYFYLRVSYLWLHMY